MIENVTDTNYIMYAIQNYDNPSCIDDEDFEDDMKRFKYLKRLLNKYQTTGELKERLILNHLTVLLNVFGPEAVNKLLFLRLGEEFSKELKPFLIMLSILPDVIKGVRGECIETVNIPMDINIIQRLRKL